MRIERLSAIGGLMAASLIPSAGNAQELGKSSQHAPLSLYFPIDDVDPEGHLPTEEEQLKRPLDVGYLLMDLDERAELARRRDDWPSALKYHRAGAKLMPDRAISFALVCEDYEKLGKRREALESCGTALGLPGAKLEHFVRFVHLVASHPGQPDAKEVEDALAAIEHVKQQPGAQLAGYELQCELSVRTKDQAALEECSRELARAAPSSPRAVSFSWALALQKGEVEGARALLDQAAAKGVDPSALDKMRRATAEAEQSQADAQSSASGMTLSDRLGHPMVRWLVGLVGVLLLGLAIGRRIVRGGTLSR